MKPVVERKKQKKSLSQWGTPFVDHWGRSPLALASESARFSSLQKI